MEPYVTGPVVVFAGRHIPEIRGRGVTEAIVVTQHEGPLLDACLGTLRTALAPLGPDAELFVVDNSASGIDAGGARVVGEGRNLGFAGGVARGLDTATGKWVLLVNDDAELEPASLQALLAAGRAAPRAGR